MKIKDDLYKRLGIKRNASKAEIKKAFHKKAAENHPDKKGGNHAEMSLVNIAYETLKDDAKRHNYDHDFDDLPPTEQMALSVAIEVFMSCINPDPRADILDAAIGKIQKISQAGRRAISETQAGVKLYGGIIKRLERRKGANKGLLHHAIETEMEKAERSIAQDEHKIEINDMAIEMLKEYKYTPEQGQPEDRSCLGMYFNVTGGGPGTGAW